MKKLGLFLILVVPAFVFQACENDDKVKEISKKGSIETSIKVDHLNDSLDILVITNKVWIRNALVKTTIHADTVPTLGTIMEEAENDNGDTQNVLVKKDYELYITVK